MKKALLTIQNVYTQFQSPLALMRTSEGAYVILEELGHALCVCDASLNIHTRIGTRGSGAGEFVYPTDITCDNEGKWYITDRWNHRVQCYSARGVWERSWGVWGNEAACLCEPWGIAYDRHKDLVVVVDRGNARIVHYDRMGRYVSHMGICGLNAEYYSGPQFKRNMHYQKWLHTAYSLETLESSFYSAQYAVGHFEYPDTVAIDDKGIMYVTDRVNNMIVLFNEDGSCRESWENVEPGVPFVGPSRIRCFSHGVWIGEELHGRIVWKTPEGANIVFMINDTGYHVSDFYYDEARGELLVCDAWHNALIRYTCEGPL